MTSDLVKRLRLQSDTSLMRLPENHIYVSHEEAADRIEQLEKAVDILQAAMVAKKPIPLRFKKAITEARAALENKNEQSAED